MVRFSRPQSSHKQRLITFYRITWCLLLQLIILFRFSCRTAEDQVMTKCIKFLTLRPTSTSAPSFQQLYTCGSLIHCPHFSPSKQADTDSRDHRPQCMILGSMAHRAKMKMKLATVWSVTERGRLSWDSPTGVEIMTYRTSLVWPRTQAQHISLHRWPLDRWIHSSLPIGENHFPFL